MADIDNGKQNSDDVSWEEAFSETSNGQAATGLAAPPMTESSRRTSAGGVNIDFLLDIKLTVTAEIGRKRLPIDDLLQMSQGSVIELEKPVGDSIDIYVNGKLMARGEVVVVNEKFGIRLTDIIGPEERIQQLG